ncbi:MAG: hypothetical protein FJ385_01180 [Verrucomicrobia bacterium]|nr:hypothetical protein [Verrucomicrobiota bacterium]
MKKNRRHVRRLALMSAVSVVPAAVHADDIIDRIEADLNDARFETGTSAQIVSGPTANGGGVFIGRQYYGNGLGHYVVPFALPDYGPGTFSQVSVSFRAEGEDFYSENPADPDGPPIYNGSSKVSISANLFAIPGARNSSVTIESDVNDGTNNHMSRGTLVQSNFFEANVTSTNTFTTSDPGSAAALSQWLNDAYLYGENAYRYVFLRISPTVLSPNNLGANNDPDEGFAITAANYWNKSFTPYLSYTFTPADFRAPYVNQFAASPAVILDGGSSTLSWDVSGDGVTITIDDGPGGIAPVTATGNSGSLAVTPSATTTYTLSAVNSFGDQVRTAVVTVRLPETLRLNALTQDASFGTSTTTGAVIGGPDEVDDAWPLIHVGEKYYGDGNRHYVVPFRLPENLGTGGFSNVRVFMRPTSGEPSSSSGPANFNVNLFALPDARDSANTLRTDVGDGIDDFFTRGTLIKEDWWTPSTPLGLMANTGASGDAMDRLSDWLTEAYGNGENAGKYVFLRLSPDVLNVSGYRGYRVSTANNPTSTNRPYITAVFDPSIVGPPAIAFSANPTAVNSGEYSTLSWTISGADSASITPDIGSVNPASGAVTISNITSTRTYTLTATGPAGTRSKTVSIGIIGQGPYRYYRFVPVANRGYSNGGEERNVQLTEFQMVDINGVWISGAVASSPEGNWMNNEEPAKGSDGSTETKWNASRNFEGPLPTLVLDHGTPTVVYGYRWATGNDAPQRDPVSWRVEGSNNLTDWDLLDERSNHPVTLSRSTYLDRFLIAPFDGSPQASLKVGPASVTPGEPVTLSWEVVGNATAISITPGFPTLSSTGIRTVYPTEDTTYTLTATNANGSSTSSSSVTVATSGMLGATYQTFHNNDLQQSVKPIANLFAIEPDGLFNERGPIRYGSGEGADGIFNAAFPSITRNDRFIVLWRGWLNTAQIGLGDYTFGLGSDDGSVLYLDLNEDGDFADAGELVVDNTSWINNRTATVNISREAVQFAIAYYDDGDRELMQARYAKGASRPYQDLADFSGTNVNITPYKPLTGLPIINSFTATPDSTTAGSSVTLAWSVLNVDGVSIDNGVGTIAAPTTSTTVTPSANTTYTLTVSNELGTRTASVSVAVIVPADPLVYTFDDRTLQGWTDLTVPNTNNGPRYWTAADSAPSGIWNQGGKQSGAGAVELARKSSTSEDDPHPRLLLRSPEFSLNGSGDLTVWLNGGTGSGSVIGLTDATLPANSSNPGFMGIALRGVTTGTYLLEARKASEGGWQKVTIAASQLAGLPQDHPYTLDLIDIGHGGWGWVTMDSVSIPGTTDIPGIPRIKSFTASALNVLYGEALVLSWDVEEAQSVSISDGGGTGLPVTGTVIVSPYQTTTYTLTAAGAAANRTATVTVNVQTRVTNVASIGNHSFEIDRNPSANGAFGSGDLTDLAKTTPTGWQVIATDNTQQTVNTNEIAFGYLNIVPSDPAVGTTPVPQAINLWAGSAIGQISNIAWSSLKVGDIIRLVVATGDRNVNAPSGAPYYADDSFFGLTNGLAGHGGAPTSANYYTSWITNVVVKSPQVGTPPTGFKGGTMGDLTLTHTVTSADLARSGNIGVFIASIGDRANTSTGLTAQAQSFWDNVRLSVETDLIGSSPTVASFTATPSTIASGMSSTLSWNVINATSVSIEGVGTGLPLLGTATVTPTATTNYALTAENNNGTTTASATVTINNNVLMGRTFNTIDESSYLSPIANLINLIPSASGSFTQLGAIRYDEDPSTTFPSLTTLNGLTDGDSFTVLWTGWFDVRVEGKGYYTFGAKCDDRCVIYLDLNEDGDFADAGERVVNAGLLEETTGTVNLLMDYLRFAIAFQEVGGGQFVDARYGKGQSLQWSALGPITGSSGVFVGASPGVEPPIITFTASPTAITSGGASTLSWTVDNATSVSISGLSGPFGLSGTRVVSPTASTTYTLTATGAGGTRTASATVDLFASGSFRYYRFVPLALRDSNAGMVQISEFQMLNNGVRISGATASNPGGNFPGSESPAQANDNDVSTKWLDFNIQPLVLDFGTAVNANGYRWATANDSDGRDPVSWRVEGSTNGTSWAVLDQKMNQTVTSSRSTYLTNIALGGGGGSAAPTVAFSASPTTISPGQSATLAWSVANASTLSISPSLGVTIGAEGSATVTPSQSTTYTLTATNATGTTTKEVTVVVNLPSTGTTVSFDFDDGTFQGWSYAPKGNTGTSGFLTTRGTGDTHAGNGAVRSTYHDASHPTMILRSPQFKLNAAGDLTIWLAGGGHTSSLNGTFVADLPANSSEPGFQGVALRNTNTGKYVLSGQKTSDGNDYQQITFTKAQLDALSRTAFFTLDIIDQAHGGWGWLAADTVTIPGTFGARITAFTASPDVVLSGGSSTLAWNVTEATSVSIDNGIGTVTASGTRGVNPTATTTYTLSATGTTGTITQSVTVTIAAGGLNGKTFDTLSGSGQLDPIANLINATPSGTFVQTGAISYPNGMMPALPGITDGSDFSILWTGWFDVNVDGPGSYTFGVGSDDGSVIYLDLNDDGDFADAGEKIVSTGGGGNATSGSTGTVNLQMDAVRIAIGFYEGGGEDIMYAKFKKGSGLAYTSLDPVSGLTGHFTPTQPVSDAPVINSFSASAGYIEAGDDTTLSWNVSNASSVSIDNGVGTVSASGSATVSPAQTTTYTLTATGNGKTRTRSVTVSILQSAAFRYYSFKPTALRNPNDNSVSIAEFQILFNGSRVGGALASSPGGNFPGGESPAQGNDNSLDSKWLDFTKTNARLVLDFGTITAANGYRWYTAGDSGGRDPVGWKVEGSHDGTTWFTLDEKTAQNVPDSRKLLVGPYEFATVPEANSPILSGFAASPVSILAGSSATLSWAALFADILTLNPGSINVTGLSSYVVTPSETTTYTLTAVNAVDSTTASTTVVVASGFPVTFDFDDGTFQYWTNLSVPNTGSGPQNLTTGSGKGNQQAGPGAVRQIIAGGSEDSPHPTFLLRSPEFELNGSGNLTAWLAGGSVSGVNLAGTAVSALPANTTEPGFQGIALRNVNTGTYVLSATRTGEGDDYQQVVFTSSQLASLDPSATYTLDFIDQGHGGWGWVVMDTVTIPGSTPGSGGGGGGDNGGGEPVTIEPFQITSITMQGTVCTMAWESQVGATYTIEATDDPADPQSWTPVMIEIAPSGTGTNSMSIDLAGTAHAGVARLFMRVKATTAADN